jgi:hypothetical protein
MMTNRQGFGAVGVVVMVAALVVAGAISWRLLSVQQPAASVTTQVPAPATITPAPGTLAVKEWGIAIALGDSATLPTHSAPESAKVVYPDNTPAPVEVVLVGSPAMQNIYCISKATGAKYDRPITHSGQLYRAKDATLLDQVGLGYSSADYVKVAGYYYAYETESAFLP